MLSPPLSSSSHNSTECPTQQLSHSRTSSHGEFDSNHGEIRMSGVSRGRSKSSHHKVRTGCLRCKQRRIKCDETQPDCLRCLRINEVCPGSETPLVRIFGLTALQGFKDDFEKLCLDSFFADGSCRLALFQPSSKSFWTTILPQLCDVYLPLRHAAIALAYIHEPFYNPVVSAVVRSQSTVDNLGVVMTHFSKSLRGFREDMDHWSVAAKVSCCLIYTALTIFLYRVGAVSSHVSAGLTFLRQHEDAGLGDPALRQVFGPFIRKMFIDACTFSRDTNLRHGQRNPYEEYMHEILMVPQAMRTFEDAHEILGGMLKYAIALSQGYVGNASCVAVHLQDSMQRFAIVFSKSTIEMYNGKCLSSRLVNFHRKDLLLHYRTTRLISQFRPAMLEESYWAYTSEFQIVVAQMKELIEIEPYEPWRITLGWLPPLFLVATKCRVRTLRYEALQMLHELCRVERGWTSCVAYSLAKFAIEHEGSSCSSDRTATSDFNYIHLLSVKFDHDGQIAIIEYLQQRDQRDLGIFSASIPVKRLSKTLAGAPAINIPDPVLQAFGYSGTSMLSPRIECHCQYSNKPVRYRGKVDASGMQETVAACDTGLPMSKPIELRDSRWFHVIAGFRIEEEGEAKDKMSNDCPPSSVVDQSHGNHYEMEH